MLVKLPLTGTLLNEVDIKKNGLVCQYKEGHPWNVINHVNLSLHILLELKVSITLYVDDKSYICCNLCSLFGIQTRIPQACVSIYITLHVDPILQP